MTFDLPALKYKFDALEPAIDARTMEIHHDKHHATYVANLNKALEGAPGLEGKSIQQILLGMNSLPDAVRTAIRNNGGGHYNHTLFWDWMIPGGSKSPNGEIGSLIDTTFGGYDTFIEKFSQAALTRFGSGWSWLVLDPNKKLQVYSTANQDSPLMDGHLPLLGLDVWEHAYYLNYQNRRADYIKAFWSVVNWDVVEEMYQNGKQG